LEIENHKVTEHKKNFQNILIFAPSIYPREAKEVFGKDLSKRLSCAENPTCDTGTPCHMRPLKLAMSVEDGKRKGKIK
jgi:hypothetical protein